MKIAQVSPLYESVPPLLYGGTERVVSFLTESLVEMGHEVTLFASGDSKTRAQLQSSVPKALRLANTADPYACHILQLQQVVEMAGQFDIIHFHTDYFHFPVSRISAYTHVTTLHGRLDFPELSLLYQKFYDMPLISISRAQQSSIPTANWVGNVYHGIPASMFKPGLGNGGYAVFLGRFSREKRVDRAIEIAAKAGLPLKIAAKLDKNDREYFESEIKHLLVHPGVEYVGEVNDIQKQVLLGNAKVLLLPIDWPEPFGMVMIEALACGTPVVAYGHGSVPEIIDHGKNGFVVSTVDEAVDAMKHIDSISRAGCRADFLNRFECKQMASAYLTLYEKVINENEQIRLPASNQKNKISLKKILSA